MQTIQVQVHIHNLLNALGIDPCRWVLGEEINAGGFSSVIPLLQQTDPNEQATDTGDVLKVVPIYANFQDSRLNDHADWDTFYQRSIRERTIWLSLSEQKTPGVWPLCSSEKQLPPPSKEEAAHGYPLLLRTPHAPSSLANLLKSGSFSIAVIIQILADVLTALEAFRVYQPSDGAQTAPLVHRDIKPDNILLAPRNRILAGYLTDFGTAKPICNTGNNTGIFTPEYASPEVRYPSPENPITFASDLYSVGCVLAEALKILKNYRESFSQYTTLSGSDEEDPHYTALFNALLKIAKKATQERPKDRYESPTAMKKALLALLPTAMICDAIHPVKYDAAPHAQVDELKIAKSTLDQIQNELAAEKAHAKKMIAFAQKLSKDLEVSEGENQRLQQRLDAHPTESSSNASAFELQILTDKIEELKAANAHLYQLLNENG